MARKKDIRRIEAIANEFGMSPIERREFGDFVEQCKRHGDRGSGKDGDFSYSELRIKAVEFRGENP
jgi:hypothetical protein